MHPLNGVLPVGSYSPQLRLLFRTTYLMPLIRRTHLEPILLLTLHLLGQAARRVVACLMRFVGDISLHSVLPVMASWGKSRQSPTAILILTHCLIFYTVPPYKQQMRRYRDRVWLPVCFFQVSTACDDATLPEWWLKVQATCMYKPAPCLLYLVVGVPCTRSSEPKPPE